MGLAIECTLIFHRRGTNHRLVVTQINIGRHLGICVWCGFNNIGESFPVCNGTNKIITVFILSHRSKYLWQRITSSWVLRPCVAKCGCSSTVRDFCFCGLSALYGSPWSFIITIL